MENVAKSAMIDEILDFQILMIKGWMILKQNIININMNINELLTCIYIYTIINIFTNSILNTTQTALISQQQ